MRGAAHGDDAPLAPELRILVYLRRSTKSPSRSKTESPTKMGDPGSSPGTTTWRCSSIGRAPNFLGNCWVLLAEERPHDGTAHPSRMRTHGCFLNMSLSDWQGRGMRGPYEARTWFVNMRRPDGHVRADGPGPAIRLSSRPLRTATGSPVPRLRSGSAHSR